MYRSRKFLPLLAAAALSVGCAASGQPGIASTVGSGTATSSASTGPTSSGADTGDIDLAGATITVVRSTGSIAPPYNHEWTVVLTGNEGTLTFQAKYMAGEPSWHQNFSPTEAAAQKFRAAIEEQVSPTGPDHSGEQTVGGPTGSYSIVTSGGKKYSGTLGGDDSSVGSLGAISDAAQAVVPVEVWKKVEGQYLAWQKNQK
jgi:hypothetical protein